MKLKCNGDRKAQLMAGVEPWDSAEIEIAVPELSEGARAVLADDWAPKGLVHATGEAAREAIEAEAARRAEAEAEAARRTAELDQAIDAWIADPGPWDRQARIEFDISYTKYFEPDYPPCLKQDFWGASHEAREKAITRREELRAEARRLTEESRAAVADQIEAAREAKEAALAAEHEAEKKRKAEALRVKKARRAEIGAVEIEISRGGKEWGTPWGAVITSGRGRDKYDFTASDYDLSTEILTIRCQPGDVIAWGQKNFRQPRKTIHERRRITDDWRMVSL